MSRVVLQEGKQREFIEEVKKSTGLCWRGLSEAVDVSLETLKDWRRERYFASHEALLKLNKISDISLPKPFKILPEYWHISEAGKKGALARMKIYGLLGTIESRRKGGLVSQKRRRENPEKYRALGCNLRKIVAYPSHSSKLAEAFGILLGDGSISPFQVSITLHRFDDKKYAWFVKRLFEDLFKIKVALRKFSSGKNTLTLQMSGANLVDFLVEQGLKVGNKVAQQVAIPDWIMKNQEYARACLRGLMDTDGSACTERHYYKNQIYAYKVLILTNYSLPIMEQCRQILMDLGIKTIANGPKRFSIRTRKQIQKYVKLIGANNPKHMGKLLEYGGVA